MMQLRRPPASLLAAVAILSVLTGCALGVREPIGRAGHRATPLSFGLYVTPDPAENPISPPERFTGYHVGVDFEVSSAERDADVEVIAVCGGDVLYSGFAEGYGGVLVHRCSIGGNDVTVLYGHLAPKDLPVLGSRVVPGRRIGLLAPARTEESGGNRKHLHFGIHRGKTLDLRGYVEGEGEIDAFIDPLRIIPWSATRHLGIIRPYWQGVERNH